MSLDQLLIESQRDLISALGERVSILTFALQSVADGDTPRPRAKEWRDDGKPSKADKCPHDLFMYEDCGRCIEDFARSFLASADTRPEGGDSTKIEAPFKGGAVPEGQTPE